jgi:hypothetical protein
MKAVHDESPEELRVILPDVDTENPQLFDRSSDPFAKSVEKIKEYGGLSATTKRRITRQIQKSVGLGIVGDDKPLAEGKGGARSKARIDKYATGYGAFDVVEPPYNLDYLAKLYEISPAHKAAVDAKVTNIAGLGYHFIESELLKEQLSDINSDEELKEARKSMIRAKKSLTRWIDSLNNDDTFIEGGRYDFEVNGLLFTSCWIEPIERDESGRYKYRSGSYYVIKNS